MGATVSRSRNYIFAGNAISTLLLVAVLLVTYAWPQYLHRVHLTKRHAQMLVLNLVSLLLLLAWLQRNLSWGWRAFSLIGSFLVLAESWLIAFD